MKWGRNLKTYKFEDDIDLLTSLPKIKEIRTVSVCLPEEIIAKSSILCIDIDISAISAHMKDSEGNFMSLHLGLRRYHTIYISKEEVWLPIMQKNKAFWRKAAMGNTRLLDIINDK